MITASLRHSPVAFLVFFGLLAAARLAWGPVLAFWGDLSAPECMAAGVAVFLAGGATAVLVRATALARESARAVAELPRAELPADVHELARRAGVSRLTGLDGADCTAFCAGLLRPTVHITSGAIRVLGRRELEAVLVHEATHARRRDPLRRLLIRAAADAWPFIPVLNWWSRHRMERAELIADRAALARTNADAVAGALWAAAGGRPNAPRYGSTFDGAVQARLSQLVGEPPPTPRPAVLTVAASIAGLLGMIVLTLCLGPGVFARA
jgi:hypothetical protein